MNGKLNLKTITFILYILERHVKPEEIGLEENHGPNSEGKQPFMVAFFKNGPKLSSADAGARRKREARRWRSNGYSENYLRNPLTGMHYVGHATSATQRFWRENAIYYLLAYLIFQCCCLSFIQEISPSLMHFFCQYYIII